MTLKEFFAKLGENDINAGIYQNSAKTLSNYTAQCIGAKKYDRVDRLWKIAMMITAGFFFTLSLVIFPLAGHIMKQAIALSKGRIRDDMTVLVMGIWENME